MGLEDTAPRGVLWDLDGTLVDSEEHHWRSWRETMAGEGIALTYEQFRGTFGQRNDTILRKWLGDDTDPRRIERIGDAKEELYRRLVRMEGLAPLPGAADWVRRLRSEGWEQAIASSAPRLNIVAVLTTIGLAEDFDASVSAEDVNKGKPDPQVFLLAAERLGVPPARAIVVEDAAAGIEAARRGGMRSIAVTRDGARFPADIVVCSLAELPPDAFRSLLARGRGGEVS
jgi:HAD superfamily hydrolase (TIGR01509 family)